jgi:hypothetical protein
MSQIQTTKKHLLRFNLPAAEAVILFAGELGAEILGDQCPNEDKIGLAVVVDGKRFFGKGQSKEDALSALRDALRQEFAAAS